MGCTPDRAPPALPLPDGVRTASTITAVRSSVIMYSNTGQAVTYLARSSAFISLPASLRGSFSTKCTVLGAL